SGPTPRGRWWRRGARRAAPPRRSCPPRSPPRLRCSGKTTTARFPRAPRPHGGAIRAPREELGHGEAEDGVAEVGGDLGEGHEDEPALREPGVGGGGAIGPPPLGI